jgi:RNA polymerase sigma-70 factor, ECF subfamily
VRLAIAGRVAGDGTDFDVLYRRYYPGVRRLILRSVHDPRIADDLAQETFLRFWRALPKLDLGQPIWPWLVTVATRATKNASKPNHEVTSDVSDSDARFDREDSAPNPEKRALDNELTIATLRPLNQRHKRVLFLRYVVGWTQAEIAEYEQSSPRAVNMTLVRAREAAKRTRDLPALLWLSLERIARRVRRVTARIQNVAAELVAGAASYVGAGIYLVNQQTLGAAVLVAASVIGFGLPTADAHASVDRVQVAEINPSASRQTSSDGNLSARGKRIPTDISRSQDIGATAGASAANTFDGKRESVNGKVWRRLPDEIPQSSDTEAGTDFNLYCDKGVIAQAVCDGLSMLP